MSEFEPIDPAIADGLLDVLVTQLGPTVIDPLGEMPGAPGAHVLDIFVPLFQRQANGIACRLGAPVWLVGSALTNPDQPNPRDWDVRVVVSDRDMKRLFGCEDPAVRSPARMLPNGEVAGGEFLPWEWVRAYENLKQSRKLAYIFARNIDFQVQSETEAHGYRNHPRLRLDVVPDWVLAADV